VALRVLISGATGFVGGHLAEALLARSGVEIHGLSRGGVWPPECAHLYDQVKLHRRDLAEPEGLAELLAAVQPEWIVHLAGLANPKLCRQEPEKARRENLDATRCLYEAVARWGGKPRILGVSTSHVYGQAGGRCDESTPIQPTSPYAASKADAELAGSQYAASAGLDIMRVRPFNHTGPRQSKGYVVPDFASQIAVIERGENEPPMVETGNLSAFCDLTDVRDVVLAYILLMEKGRRGEVYNIGSGRLVRIGNVLDQLLGMSAIRAQVREETRDRPAEAAAPVCDAGKLRRETGWQPRIPLEQTLRDTLEYWRSRS
jgi:GDP-4-dehydro-6-deoxy-D-mannose reductase